MAVHLNGTKNARYRVKSRGCRAYKTYGTNKHFYFHIHMFIRGPLRITRFESKTAHFKVKSLILKENESRK